VPGMGSELGLDHIVIVVAELDAGVRDYEALGFTVVRGGVHEGAPTHNALIGLADGTYLELIAFRGAVDEGAGEAPPSAFWAMVRSWGRLPEGLAHFALLPADTASAIAAAGRRGLALAGPVSGSRRRPDGQLVAWETGIPGGLALPFLCGDVTPRELRVPGGAAAVHANGVVGIAGVTVAVDDLGEAAGRYAALLGVEPELAPAAASGNAASFALAAGTITLVAPVGDEDGALATRLAERGPGLHALRLRVAAGADTGPLDRGLAHGAVIERVAG
jgi:catechol 2,3-dioxygenase-like lactoylglutathione lyase family enzyme